MKFKDIAVRDFAQGVWMLDDSSPFDDASGHGNTATATGTTTSFPLVSGTTSSRIFSSTSTGSFPTTVPNQNSYTIEAWVMILDGPYQTQMILGHAGTYDGLVVESDGFSFVTKFLTSGESRAKLETDISGIHHLVGVHTPLSNILYVDGISTSAEISYEQQIDSTNTGTTLVCGESSTAQRLVLSGVAVYGYAMTSDQVTEHLSTRNTDISGTIHSNNGIELSLDASAFDLSIARLWESDDDWEQGGYTDVYVDSGIGSVYVDEVPIAGTWLNSVDLNVSTEISQSLYIDYTGYGAQVEYSFDSTTWTVVTSDESIPFALDPVIENNVIFLRVSFEAGVEGHVGYLSLIVIPDPNTKPVSGYTINTDGVVGFKELSTLTDDSGTDITSKPITVSSGTPYSTVEVWLKRTGATAFSKSFTAANSYKNGASYTAPVQGEWSIVHYTSSSPITTPITLSGDARVARVVLYATILTSQEVSDIVNSYATIPTVLADSGGTVAITQPNQPSLYGYNWSIA